ncbi:hypothetical protein [Bradyrhizobium sp. AUGA SZCCT0042]|uniref:hypothetical protein n=1 Tax=Bradyrhizobium sp. AUGA SZCCT0042 TaxID=2807651 RepID=UPI001BA4F3BE|nr:hypothetical protein [Bradyrhizobium sp. AUGA SZCCT0042]MBR1298542.1 hypothetical protein [Bradyrhizobium sp. AUGA SZCCT0042]
MGDEPHDQSASEEDAKAVLRRLRKTSKELPSLKETVDYLLEILAVEGHGSDRLLALFAGSLIEVGLEVRLHHLMRRDLTVDEYNQIFSADRNGFLATFGARIAIGYALNIFGPKALADLKTINVIRNTFAHSLQPLHFDDPDIRTLCFSLQDYDDAASNIELPRTFLAFRSTSRSTAKHRFINASVSIAANLQLLIKDVDTQIIYTRRPLP